MEFSGPQSAIESVEEAFEDDPFTPVVDGDLFVVWFAYTLGNWKSLVSTNRYKGVYWEVTHDTHDGVTYVDKYVKQNQVILEDIDDDDNEKEN